jgi:hypothetical protein
MSRPVFGSSSGLGYGNHSPTTLVTNFSNGNSHLSHGRSSLSSIGAADAAMGKVIQRASQAPGVQPDRSVKKVKKVSLVCFPNKHLMNI